MGVLMEVRESRYTGDHQSTFKVMRLRALVYITSTSQEVEEDNIIGAYPLGLFSPGTFICCSAHAVAPSRLECTTGKSETLINGASTSYERLRKAPPLLEDVLSRSKES